GRGSGVCAAELVVAWRRSEEIGPLQRPCCASNSVGLAAGVAAISIVNDQLSCIVGDVAISDGQAEEIRRAAEAKYYTWKRNVGVGWVSRRRADGPTSTDEVFEHIYQLFQLYNKLVLQRIEIYVAFSVQMSRPDMLSPAHFRDLRGRIAAEVTDAFTKLELFLHDIA